MDERDRFDGHERTDGPVERADDRGEEAETHGTGESSPDHGRLREALRAAHPSASFPAEEIEAGIRASVARRVARGGAGTKAGEPWWRGPTARSVLAAAAALIVFIGGTEYGRRTASQPAAASPVESGVPAATASGQAVSVPLAIQSAGSRYVASLARFSGEAGQLSSEERRMAREVALAALYGAALELLREAGEDETLQAVTEMVARRRRITGELNDGARRF